MEFGTWFWMWAVGAVVLIVAELFTSGFFMLPFGLGAAVAAVLAATGQPLAWQWVAFVAVSIAALVGLRPLADRLTHEPPQKVAVDRVIGKEAVVIERLDPDQHAGRVRVDREEWRAEAPGCTPLEVGARVIVERVDGTRLIVRPAGATSTDECKAE